MSSSRKSTNILSLRELHLVPHFIYLVERARFDPNKQYALEIWKDNTKIGVENDMIKNNAAGSQKHASLQFQKLRFVFDVQALFQEKSEASIVLKLTEKDVYQQKQVIIDEFHLHILYYNYEFSKDKYVRYKQNSVGKINNFILNYSFSAIYGERLESLLFRKHEKKKGSVLLEDLYLAKKDSKYGIIVKDDKKPIDTIFLLQTVAQKGMADMEASKKNIEINPESSQLKKKGMESIHLLDEQDGLENVRKAARSILDDVANQKDESTLTENDLIEQLRAKGNLFSTLILILLSSYLIFFLMHPNKKL